MPFTNYTANRLWLLCVVLAQNLTCWFQLLGLDPDDPLARATPKTLRYRLFHIGGRLIAHARKSNIRVGPGRGSAAGCAVAYCLRITDLDPIKYDLLFERFLNPERVSLPDIDVDFCERRRGEVIDYVTKKRQTEAALPFLDRGEREAQAGHRFRARLPRVGEGAVH